MSLRLRAPNTSDDRALLAGFAKTGDQAAFAALVERHGPLVLGVCRRVLRDPHLADDAFQAVFLVLAKRAGGVRVGPSLACWLFGVARRVALAARRRELRRRNAERGAQSSRPDAAPPTPDWDELLRVLDEELARLPEKLRAPVIECFFREKTQDEAAKSLGWSLSTLRRRLDRAKEVLRARLTTRGATLAGVLAAGAFAASAALAAVPPALAQATLRTATGGAVPPAVAALATGGRTMSLGVKLGIGALLVGGVGLAVGLALPSRELPPAPPAVPVEAKPIALPKPAKAKPTPAPKAVEPPKPILVPEPSPSAQPAVSGEWAAVRGRVVWPRNVALPTPKPIAPTADKPHCESQGQLLDTAVLVNPTTRGLKNVVVWLRPDTSNRRDPFPKDKINPQLLSAKPRQHVIDQPCCQFVPRVLAAREGDTLVIKNSSPVPHNTNFSADDPALTFNVTLPPDKEFRPSGPLKAQGSPIPFKCDIHQWMQGRIRVFDHPYFAVTDANGNFEIPNAPVGKWRLVYWHENGYHKGRAGLLGVPVDVTAGGATAPTIEYEFPK